MGFDRVVKFLLSCLLFLGLLFAAFPSQAVAEENTLEVYFFYSATCPHCMKQEPLMEYIDETYEEIDVISYEVTQNPQVWDNFREEYGISNAAVPRTFIGEMSFIGYTEQEGDLEYNPVYNGYSGYRNQIIQAIENQAGIDIVLPEEAEENSSSGLPWYVFSLSGIYLVSYPFVRPHLKSSQKQRYWIGGFFAVLILSLFWFVTLVPDALIQQFARQLPFPLFVSIVALADGFNPCAFTVLIILLSLLTYTKSRRDMTIVGTTFITTSAVMYFIFIMLMVSVGSVFIEQYGNIVLVVLGILVTAAGIINIKDYFFFKKNISLTLSNKQQVAITKRASSIVRNLQHSTRDRRFFATAIGGTVVLAAFVNLVELGCTAILPTVYMASLVQRCQGGINLCGISWTALYAAIYVVPLFAILFNFIYSFKSARITEKQGRVLKLVGGSFMLFFGLVMIAKPQLLMLG
ncbi:glutaredoxin family protein [Baaleninema sp.]|uniref:glutaredoxin family protein n=1 Tax=Baaleninema sp. TaxID=3101197 RepID=UPI003D004FF9